MRAQGDYRCSARFLAMSRPDWMERVDVHGFSLPR